MHNYFMVKAHKDTLMKIVSLFILSKILPEHSGHYKRWNLPEPAIIFQLQSRIFQMFYDMPKLAQSRTFRKLPEISPVLL